MCRVPLKKKLLIFSSCRDTHPNTIIFKVSLTSEILLNHTTLIFVFFFKL